MAKRFSRAEVLARLRERKSCGEAIIAAGAGTGISAKCIEKGGADLIVVYNSGRYRMAGLPSVTGLLAYGDANAIVMEMGEREILPVVKNVPVIAGVNGTDPTRDIPRFLKGVKEMGFSGVNNFPTVGVFDGKFRRKIESLGLGYAREVEMFRCAQRLDLFTMAYTFTPGEAALMSEAGVDVVIAHLGTTGGGSVGISEDLSLSLEEAVEHVREVSRVVKDINKEIILLVHGGPLVTPDDVAKMLGKTEAVGFVGASSMERVPVEEAIINVTSRFRRIKIAA